MLNVHETIIYGDGTLVMATVCTSGGTKSRRAKDFFLSLLDDDVILLLV